ncbi:hypothetical protein HanRHA438_Chr07g0307631 [Helianthus annuus]|uniref:Uncharacterized protein n=1 Tax=Helianthus annuus TaxID=4232 RepID=A0A9K3NFW2_HELAN|nr:hypothetical protein HanXRQr2_Chr07g0297331 [Helianthus annuus]KAJ0550364.1 hypothetical protein HanHA300_Chr07g0244561 [Helianthus annuus]KAJ0563321.1 hypothetical protein HanHA89_Chr07g0261771 [Helianthus annuus]KAJ0904916.1 hypothetical protein HanPSC8_Chr07g0287851 [Helianthus annuus]KAJ0908191.1 hypothetical protein HanRHA438_Chr07g0307631 [Helianthus annuus]
MFDKLNERCEEGLEGISKCTRGIPYALHLKKDSNDLFARRCRLLFAKAYDKKRKRWSMPTTCQGFGLGWKFICTT